MYKRNFTVTFFFYFFFTIENKHCQRIVTETIYTTFYAAVVPKAMIGSHHCLPKPGILDHQVVIPLV